MAKKTATASETKTFTLTKGDEKKHSVVYNCDDEGAPLKSAYVMRVAWTEMPEAIDVAMTPRR